MERTPPELKVNARALRRDATDAERMLWSHLRTLRPRFTRQLVVSHHIVDFACRSLKIAVEVDGGQHMARADKDAARTAYLETLGWTVLRFWNHDVLANAEAAIEVILATVVRVSTHPQPLPFREGSEKPLPEREGLGWVEARDPAGD